MTVRSGLETLAVPSISVFLRLLRKNPRRSNHLGTCCHGNPERVFPTSPRRRGAGHSLRSGICESFQTFPAEVRKERRCGGGLRFGRTRAGCRCSRSGWNTRRSPKHNRPRTGSLLRSVSCNHSQPVASETRGKVINPILLNKKGPAAASESHSRTEQQRQRKHLI